MRSPPSISDERNAPITPEPWSINGRSAVRAEACKMALYMIGAQTASLVPDIAPRVTRGSENEHQSIGSHFSTAHQELERAVGSAIAGKGSLLAAVADVHAPENLELFETALRGLLSSHGEPAVLLFVGDLVEKNDHAQMSAVLDVLDDVGLRCPVFACFGNEEYEDTKEEYLSYERVRWLDDEVAVIELEGARIGILGSRGSLDRPTWWQRTHVPEVRSLYKRRVKLIDQLLAGLRADVVVVMTHYAPTYRTLVGERERIWPEMACRALEDVIERREPHLWLHGHGHKATALEARLGGTLVANVSLPARRAIFRTDLGELARRGRRPRGLGAFM